LLGVRGVLEDIDARRDYWRETPSVVSKALEWVAGPGWREFFEDKGEPWDKYGNAEAFRQRHLMDGFTALASVLSRRR
jgi:hypothetical protein